jgi:WD40 repeat protein
LDVTFVQTHGPAEKAGIHEVDIVVTLQGRPIASLEDLDIAMQDAVEQIEREDADALKFDVLRSGETVRVNVPFPVRQLNLRTHLPTQPADSQPKNINAVPKRLHHFPTRGRVKTIAYSADGKLIAIANGNVTFPLADDWKRSVEILDAESEIVVSLKFMTEEEDALLAATEGLPHFEVEALAFSPDGNLVAVGTGMGQVKLLNPRTGELVRSLDDEPAKLAEKKTPKQLKSLTRAMGSVASLAFSPDGSLLAMCGSSFDDVARNWGGVDRLGRRATGPGRLKVWDVGTAELKHDLVGHSHANAAAFSPDGKLLASAGNWQGASDWGTGVVIWNPRIGKKIRSLETEANGGAR